MCMYTMQYVVIQALSNSIKNICASLFIRFFSFFIVEKISWMKDLAYAFNAKKQEKYTRKLYKTYEEHTSNYEMIILPQ